MEIKIKSEEAGELKGIYMPVKDPKAGVILVHGLGEHTGRYIHFAEYFNKNGYSFIGLDLPGHGKSPGKRGHIRSLSVCRHIIDSMLAYLRNESSDLPVVLYGHSLGGAIALNYLLSANSIQKAVISSPWLKLVNEPPGLKVLMASIVQFIMPSFTQSSGLDPQDFTSDPGMLEDYYSDPLNHPLISVRLYLSAARNASELLEYREKITVPLLIIHGAKDRVSSVEGSKVFSANNSRAELRIWEEGGHELHNETFREEVMEYVVEWLNKGS
jgi:alpha-beta hydrolase superfamily lysophospholipase